MKQLSSLDIEERKRALRELVEREPDRPGETQDVNLHIHTFFSFNARNRSPAHVAWEAHRAGLYAAGICDFDVLDGLAEFYRAGLSLSLRCAVHLETRAFFQSYRDQEINSPGEPGVAYVMGAGFGEQPPPDTEQHTYLQLLRRRAEERNRDLLDRISRQTSEIPLDYDRDVVPLTPSGNATERHIVTAYAGKISSVFNEPKQRLSFLSGLLERTEYETETLSMNTANLEEALRSRLVKRGGIGYEPPTPASFPPMEEFIRWVTSCRSIPMYAWLDGTNKGEENPSRLLRDVMDMGILGVNIIPDRNWNVPDPEVRRRKIRKLDEFVRTADQLGLPVNIGTEMNKPGLPAVDDLNGEVLSRFREVFVRGARIITGHCLLARYTRLSFSDSNGDPGPGKSRFFEEVGSLPPPDRSIAENLLNRGRDNALAVIHDSVRAGNWTV